MGNPFEIDPSIMLMRPRESNAGESLASLFNAGSQRQTAALERQQMQYQMARQQSLADLARQTAGNYADPTAQTYASGGFAEQAAQAQAAAIQRQQQQMALQESAAKLEGIHRNLTASRLAAAKTQEDFDKVASGLPAEYGLKPGAADWQDRVKAFRQSLITPEQEAENNKTRYKTDAFGRVLDTFTGQLVGDAMAKGGGAGGVAGLVSPNQGGLDILVHKAVRDGELPKFGSGALGMQQRAVFLNRMDELFPGADLATAHAQYRANMHNLTEATTQGGAQDVKEGKALGDIQILKGAMSKIWGSSIPALNALGRTIEEARGDPNYRSYTTALEATLPSINAVLNSGQMSVGAREEVKSLLREKDSPAAMNAALDILTRDMARSSEATHKRVSNARANLAALPPGKGSRGAAANPHQAAADWARANPDDPDAKAVLEKALKQGAK